MNTTLLIGGLAAWYILCGAAGVYGARLFPKYRRHTPVFVDYGHGNPILGEYLYRSAIGFHKVRVSPGDGLGWAGRVITARTSDLHKAVSS